MNYKFLLISLLLFPTISQGQSKSEMADSKYKEGVAAYHSNQLDEASQLFEQSLRALPTAKASYMCGLVYEAQGKGLRALSAYETALTINPYYHEAKFQKALVYLKYGDPNQAIDDLTDLINADGSMLTQSVIFQIDDQGGSQNKVMTVSNMKATFYHYRGKAYLASGKHEEALTDFAASLEKEKTATVLIDRALLYHKEGKPDDAINDLKKALELSPESELAWYNLAMIDPSTTVPPSLLNDEDFGPLLILLTERAIEKEDYFLALQYLNKSIDVDTIQATSYINRGRVLMKLEQYGSARRDLHRARSIAPEQIESLYLIGNTYFFENSHKMALAYYDQYLAADYQNGMVWYNAAICHHALEQREEACHYLARAKSFGLTQASDMLERICK
ncbi:MAG: tetratricopeptide (TPR) repeat protein [Marinoscillum sp.]|jgi:tetratricopeptide (TPR) repeat protein